MLRSILARRSAASLLCVLIVQASGVPFFSATSEAAPPTKLTILPWVRGAGAPDRANVRFAELLSGELQGRTQEVRLIAAPDAGAPEPTRSSKDAIAALSQGQALLSDLKFEAAAKAIRSGIEKLTSAPEDLDYPKLVEAWMSLAVAQFRMGDEGGAAASLLNVVRLSPKYRLPEGRYPPVFVREFEKARRRAEKLPKVAVSIDAPPGSTAFLNGEDLGMVPVVEEGIVPGTHYVKVEGARGERFGQVIDVKSGVQKVTASFSGGALAVGPVLDKEAAAAAMSACRASGAEFALVGVVFRTGDHQLTVATALFSVSRRAFAPLIRFTVDDELLTANVEAFKLADEVTRALGKFPRATALPHDLAKGAAPKAVASAHAPRRVETEADPSERRLALSPSSAQPAQVKPLEGVVDPGASTGTVSEGAAWWVWALVGVGVAAAAGGTYYGVSQATRPVTGTVSAKW